MHFLLKDVFLLAWKLSWKLMRLKGILSTTIQNFNFLWASSEMKFLET